MTSRYDFRKKRLAKKINEFILSDDLVKLAEAYKIIRDIVRDEKFPLVEFQEYTERVIIEGNKSFQEKRTKNAKKESTKSIH